jgi:hypothetical protein
MHHFLRWKMTHRITFLFDSPKKHRTICLLEGSVSYGTCDIFPTSIPVTPHNNEHFARLFYHGSLLKVFTFFSNLVFHARSCVFSLLYAQGLVDGEVLWVHMECPQKVEEYYCSVIRCQSSLYLAIIVIWKRSIC